MKKTVKVVAAIIENENKEILCALRSTDMAMPNMWEFPGGKVEKEEDVYTALIREIKEEMNCKIETSDIFTEHTHEYETFIIELIAFKATVIEGTPQKSEHDKLIWLKRGNLASLQRAPADIPVVEQLIKEK
ncbi:8-oxo-dGTP diphosphatase [Natronobacillus azotifigens]|uniref:8-oxo-dGTP diphosphatase n=1 Tax=Natronobacillus azotifigens TaxID=472978 RepID=A0A9J6RGB4_9BACI|nr:(deoxy)nucleoside triphosphate pyrophosphohydrolase [Natronobacillus azotifigens]MCZ0704478.1 (deoxy)nucleoside triphosphate pyrophosphohydrolase [Natronobacillus azotifigens]